MENGDELFSEKEKTGKLSAYAMFYFQNIGYDFIEKATGDTLTKGVIYNKYKNRPLVLTLLTNNQYGEYERVLKKDHEKKSKWGCEALQRYGQTN